ncbi:MAG TPA: murein biosynthesis integral membrane protein MurJ [Longimicrobiales bacterium]|nr:murein biosynthesis integral membrane protein MurJ [Longimicrobiales bacterium]
MKTGRSAQLVALGILLSRIAGLVRENFIARYLGASLYADVFRAAIRGTNFLQNLLGEGTLSASFIPVYAALLEQRREEEAGRVAGAIFALLFAVVGVLTLVGIAAAPLFVTIFYNGFTGEKRELTIICTRIMFPMTGILALSAWALAILNSHRKFLLAYLAPVAWNVAIIATLVVFTQGRTERELVVLLAWGAVAGGVLQFLVQMPTVLRLERELKLSFNTKLPGVRQAVKNAGPAISGRGVVQVSGWVDMFLASYMGTGAVALLGYAQMLYMLPVSLFGMSVAAAELPELSRERDAALDKVARRVNGGLQQIAVLVVPSTIGYFMLGDVIVAALYQGGEFGARETLLTTLILMAYTIGLLASTATRMFSSAFFALQDTRTPARIAFIRVAIAAVIGGAITLYVRAVPEYMPYGPAGLAAAAGIAAWVEWALLRSRLHLRLPGVGIGRVLAAKLLGIALGAALIARGIEFLLPDLHPILVGTLVLVPYAAIYLTAVHLLGIEARIPLIGRFLRRR